MSWDGMLKKFKTTSMNPGVYEDSPLQMGNFLQSNKITKQHKSVQHKAA